MPLKLKQDHLKWTGIRSKIYKEQSDHDALSSRNSCDTNPDRDVILDGAILVQGDKIAGIGKAEGLASKYPHEEQVGHAGRINIPGLISTHMHATQTLLRGE